MRGAARP
jgi:hypothetical protein